MFARAYAVAAITAAMTMATPVAAQTTNNWSFVDLLNGSTVRGTVSGIVNGSALSASGLTFIVTSAPSPDLQGVYGTYQEGSYSASNGVITNGSFSFGGVTANSVLQLTTTPSSGFPNYIASGSGNEAYNDSDRVSFTAANVAPEPGTWLLMVLGFGAIGYSMRNRRANIKHAHAA